MISSTVKKGQERRQAIRASRVIAIEHRLVKRNLTKARSNWSLSTTKNMSVSGILFLSSIPYKVGDIVEVSVAISGVIDIAKGNAKVIRVVENGDTSFDVAVKFITKPAKKRPAKTHR
ncbi:MAG: PilZ domain-containing protein [Candidatus Omnitrophica bacterium]|nr:PilZ domain-containing protein [Candidatus Omnitrophota bacterium]